MKAGFAHTALSYRLKDAAKLVGFSLRELRRKLDDGDISSTGKGKQRRITYAQLDAYVLRTEQESGFVRV